MRSGGRLSIVLSETSDPFAGVGNGDTIISLIPAGAGGGDHQSADAAATS